MPSADDSTDDENTLRRMGRHLGCAAFFHFGLVQGMADGPKGKALLASCLLLAAFPTMWPFELALIVLLFAHFHRVAFFIAPSHSLLLLCTTAHVFWNFLGGVPKTWKVPKFSSRAGAAFLATARLSTVAVYGFAFFHKLNSTFIDPATCPINHILIDQLGDTMPELIPLLLWTTLAAEGGLAVLLSVRRWKPWGIALALAFHFVLGLFGFFSFSAVMYGLLKAQGLIPLPAYALPARLERAWQRSRPIFARHRVLLLCVSCAVLFASALAKPPPHPVQLSPFWVTLWCVYAAATILTWNVSTTTIATPAPGSVPGVREKIGAFAVVPGGVALFLVFFGIGPYLGYSNVHTFDMYSGLTTLGGRSNHLLVPGSLQFGFFQSRIVRVDESNNPSLQMLRSKKAFVPYTYVREIIGWMPKAKLARCRVTLEEAGESKERRCREIGEEGTGWRFIPPFVFQFKPKVPIGNAGVGSSSADHDD